MEQRMRRAGFIVRTLCACLVLGGGALAQVPDGAEDDAFWQSVSGCTDAVEVKLYLAEFARGRHATEARACLEKMGQAAPADATELPTDPPGVVQLVQECRAHMQVERWREAWRCYEDVLEFAAKSQVAERGLGEIERVYEESMRDALGRWDIAGADEAIKAYARFAPNSERIRTRVGVWEIEIEEAKVFRDCEVCPELVIIPPGSYEMGSPEWEVGYKGVEGPLHQVTIEDALAAGRYEVTFAEWDACVLEGACYGYRPDDKGWGRARRPVINVSWKDVESYLAWLSRKTGYKYRLLSESEWEYAARAGTKTPFHYGGTLSTEQANYDGEFSYGLGHKGEKRGNTVPVGRFAPNAFGLYDVHGNVWEWVQDCQQTQYQPSMYVDVRGKWYWSGYQLAPMDGSAWVTDAVPYGDSRMIAICHVRMVRGGSWADDPSRLRSATRGVLKDHARNPTVGFRVVRTRTR